jgi:hypothetical protein
MERWGYGFAPSVYLAIVSVIANALSAYALAIGLEITFRRNALRGRTVRTLKAVASFVWILTLFTWLNSINTGFVDRAYIMLCCRAIVLVEEQQLWVRWCLRDH